MLKEDNSGFINFPPLNFFEKKSGNTFIYIIAFDVDKSYELTNNKLKINGRFLSDDISNKFIDLLSEIENDQLSNLIENESGEYQIPLITSICVGWSEDVSIYRNSERFWTASFRDLTNEGRKLYYSIKKLHNNKDVRILTIINID